jgi:[protein-PII] uridylyltransferase
VVQSVEQMKLLTILTTADIRGVGPGVWNGWKAQLLRTLYYETEPVLTGGFSEVNRAQRIEVAQAEFRAAFTEWPQQELNTYIARHYPAYWLKVELGRKIRHARFLRASEAGGHELAINVGFDGGRGVTELTILAIDHPWLLSIIAGACASAGANIVDAQIYTTTDCRALDTVAISREYERDEDEARRATRIGEMIEDVLGGKLRLPDVVAKRAISRGKPRPFVVEPEVTINNLWSDRYTVIEVSGLDRPGLLYQLTTAISKLNLNIASAHVATFGERARDVFYVTDLLGAQINAPTRQAVIKSALIHLLANGDGAEKPAA